MNVKKWKLIRFSFPTVNVVCAWAQMFTIFMNISRAAFYISAFAVFLVSSNLPPIIFMVETIFHKGIATRARERAKECSNWFFPRFVCHSVVLQWNEIEKVRNANLYDGLKREQQRWQRHRRQPKTIHKNG